MLRDLRGVGGDERQRASRVASFDGEDTRDGVGTNGSAARP